MVRGGSGRVKDGRGRIQKYSGGKISRIWGLTGVSMREKEPWRLIL